MTRKITLTLLLAFFATTLAHAADDPSIKGKLREDIQQSMAHFIDHQTADGTLHHYDPVQGKLLRLENANLHSGIVKKGDFYVSCADFTDQSGRKIDVDFLVIKAGGELRTVQALVHKVDGDKRPYHLEND